MITSDKRIRNEKARVDLARINKEEGIRWNHIALKLNTSYHSLANWKGCKYDYSEDRLKVVENYIMKFK